MLQFVPIVIAAAIAYYVFASYQKFAENLAEAKKSGIPYIWAPIYVCYHRIKHPRSSC